ncbi:MAG: patatin-like phospholipase family protein [Xanthomonadales bacterium]|nr:patatin-like phospholipase family protein [Xanthomonadales bacterium]
MLTVQLGTPSPKNKRPPRIGLALAGGGVLGLMYELGVLRSLEETLELDFTSLHAYVGVSAGAMLASGLANDISAAQICRIFIDNSTPEHRFNPGLFMRPAFGEFARRARQAPSVIGQAAMDIARNPIGGWWKSLGNFGSLVPSAMFDNAHLQDFLEQVYSVPGRTNDFRKLRHKLFIVAVDLDNGSAVRFGAPGHDHIPISKAVQASAALPGLYPSVEIEGRNYVDGALRRTLHASAALDEDLDLLIAINPLVPYDSDDSDLPSTQTLLDGGLPRVLSQTFRALIQSRMQAGIKKYQDTYKTDLILIEPNRNDGRMFFTNVFSYAGRQDLCEHAYQSGRADLRKNLNILRPLLDRHGIGMRTEPLKSYRRLVDGLRVDAPITNALASGLDRTLSRLESALG